MKRFGYRAIAGGGDVVTGEVAADSRMDAVRQLRQRALDPLSLSEGGRSRILDALNREVSVGMAGRLRLRRDFARDLALLREAGAPLDDALSILAVGEDPGAKLAQRIAQRSAAGLSVSEALQSERQVFDGASIALVAAGETAGDIAQALRTLADLTEASIETRSEMFKSLLYPAALVVASLLAMGLMIFHVLPSFEKLFEANPAALPRSTRLVFEVGGAARDAAPSLGILVLAAAVIMAVAWFTDQGRRMIDHMLLRTPVIGRLLSATDLGRALLIAGRLIAAGSTADTAVDLASETCTNSTFRRDLRLAAERIREGSAVADAFASARFVPNRVVRMIAIGESAGSLPRMLGEIARMQQDAARAGVNAVLAALPPILTVVMGILIAGMMYAVLTALLSVNELAF
jgi:type II secretory pathway component PulF